MQVQHSNNGEKVYSKNARRAGKSRDLEQED